MWQNESKSTKMAEIYQNEPQWPKIIQPNNLHKKILDGINVWIFGNNDNTIVKLTQQQSDDNVLVNELVTFLHAL